jgi:hypothetical protein
VSLSRNEADLASVSCLHDRVRRRLYAFVSGRGEPVGRDEAAAAVGIGRALAAYHLDKRSNVGPHLPGWPVPTRSCLLRNRSGSPTFPNDQRL